MNYEQALEYIHGTYKFGSKLGLDNILSLLRLMDNPHEKLKVVHVAGTNGKGSTSSFISSVLTEQGYRVGLYTSPYLEVFTERIKINGVDISKEDLARITDYVKSKVSIMLADGMNHPTEFEIVTAIGFEYFKRQKVDFLVLEVGLGGRGDSTNVITRPLVSVITPIDYDHTDYLGDTLAKIAFEKAGIIKKDSWVVTYPQQDEAMEVLKEVCLKQNSKLITVPIHKIEPVKQGISHQTFNVQIEDVDFPGLSITLLGEHQVNNAVVAITALQVLQKEHGIHLSRKAIYEGCNKTKWPGRLEVMSRKPTIIIDGAHNVHGLKAVSKVLEKFFVREKIILVLGILADKDVISMLDVIIPKVNKVVVTEPNNPRALSVDRLGTMVEKYNLPVIKEKDISRAVSHALDWADHEDTIVFCGSLYMIGQVRALLKNNEKI